MTARKKKQTPPPAAISGTTDYYKDFSYRQIAAQIISLLPTGRLAALAVLHIAETAIRGGALFPLPDFPRKMPAKWRRKAP